MLKKLHLSNTVGCNHPPCPNFNGGLMKSGHGWVITSHMDVIPCPHRGFYISVKWGPSKGMSQYLTWIMPTVCALSWFYTGAFFQFNWNNTWEFGPMSHMYRRQFLRKTKNNNKPKQNHQPPSPSTTEEKKHPNNDKPTNPSKTTLMCIFQCMFHCIFCSATPKIVITTVISIIHNSTR